MLEKPSTLKKMWKIGPVFTTLIFRVILVHYFQNMDRRTVERSIAVRELKIFSKTLALVVVF